ncbi:MAG: leucine-rich repeat domain-containing protein [Prevotellaceae bacterium]|jgi:hypothetical protein|nr:leucine-rich repeat domain-containing protein [Prevotellaceae bacterium]
MKTNSFLSLLKIACLAFGIISAGIQGNGAYANTVNVPTVRTLSSILTQEQKDTITTLKVTGFLDGSSSSYDFGVLRAMPNLQYLDLSEVVTVNSNSTPNNSIPGSAFSGNTKLKTIILPSTVTTIGGSSFDGCTSLSNVVFPDSLKTIANNYAFRNCTSLSALLFPASLQTIGDYAFDRCAGLANVQFSEGLKVVGYQSFSYCTSLKTLLFPASLQTLGNYAFYGCTGLTSLQFDGDLQTIGDYAFYNCTGLTTVRFSEGLQTIGYQSFYNCHQLEEQIELPSTINKIRYGAFQECNRLRSCKILAETPPTVDNSNSLGNMAIVYVPETAILAYQAAAFWKDKILIAGEEPNTLTLNITTPGTLGERALQQFSYLKEINVLNLSGTLNSADFNVIKNDMKSLISVDISALTNTELIDELFRDRPGLLNVKLPADLKRINPYSFYNCKALETPVFPASVEEIGNYAFCYCYNMLALDLPASLKYIRSNYAFAYCVNLKAVNFPDGLLEIGSCAFEGCSSVSELDIPQSVTSIGSNAFYGCSALKRISLPDNLTVINNYTFYNCTSLTGVILPSKLTTFGYEAFYNCNKLTSITLPAGLISFNAYAFNYCTGLQQVICLQATPPVLNYDEFPNINKATCELLVPSWALSDYKLANNWKLFPVINPYDQEIDRIVVNGSLTLNNSARPLGLPSVDITKNGNLTVRGNTPFNTNDFTLRSQLRYVLNETYYYSDYYTYFSKFISECSNMTAQQVKVDMYLWGNRWYYLSFPFDVAISDITIDADAYFVFRRYDGQTRAAQDAGSSWKNMTESDTLRAGEGYIFQCNKDVNHLVLPATDASKNKLFQPADQTFTLYEYTAENAANSHWNLVGNPSPSYFDVQFLDFTAPITYWNDYNGRYEAISPADDAFLLRPYQAFFVQKPADLSSITFLAAGRQTTTEITLRSALRSVSNDRTLINLELNDAGYGDKARVVINPDAQLGYELSCDASKFMSTELQVPQLYSLDAQATPYAINERRLDDGIVPLGFYAGSADLLTISLKSDVGAYSVILWDKYLNISTDLQAADYSFIPESGTFNDRFELRIAQNGGGTTGINATGQPETKVFVSEKNIIIETDAAGKSVTVYTVSGVKIAVTETVAGAIAIPAAQGVYMVKVDGKLFKTIVF